MKTLRKIFIILTLALAMLGTIPVQASPRFNKVAVNIKKPKKNKKKTVTIKLTNLTKQQKKKKWTFTSSDKSVVTVKRNGKNNCKVTAKSKDGYAVIRAQQGADVCYALVRVGVGSENYTPATRVWAETAGFKLPGMKTNTGGGNTNSSTPTPTPKPTRTPIGYTSDGTPYYMDKVAGATDTGKKDLDGKTIYKFGTQYIIGMTDKGVYVKPRFEIINFSVEVIPYMDQFYNKFDNGYYRSWVGKNVFFENQPVFIHIILKKSNGTVARLENDFDKSVYNIQQTFNSIISTGTFKQNFVGVVAGTPKHNNCFGLETTVVNSMNVLEVSDGYVLAVSAPNGVLDVTSTYGLSIGGVTKSVSFTTKGNISEYKRFLKDKLNEIKNSAGFNSYRYFNELKVNQAVTQEMKDFWKNLPENMKSAFEANHIFRLKYCNGTVPYRQLFNGIDNVYHTTPFWITINEPDYYRPCLTSDGRFYGDYNWMILDEIFNLTGSGCRPVQGTHGAISEVYYNDAPLMGVSGMMGSQNFTTNYKPSDVPVMVR